MSDKRDIIWLRTADRQRYAGSLSLQGKIPPTAPKLKIPTAERLGDILYNLGETYKTSVVEFESQYNKSVAEADQRFLERLPEKIRELAATSNKKLIGINKRLNDNEWLEHDKFLMILEKDITLALEEYNKAVAPYLQKRKEDFRVAKQAHPRHWWQTESLYFGGVCGNCGTILKKYCPQCNPEV